MRRMVTCLIGIVLFSSPARPAEPATATAPASQPARRPPDRLRGAVDPYEPAAERARFFQAAGVDNELARKEFAAAHGRDGSFVRSFDRLPAMLAFDKNHNGTLDWFEANAYRQDLRKRVLKAFDANRDGRLTGTERDRANAALAAGRLVAAKPGPSTGGDRQWLRQRAARQKQMLLAKHDANGNGRLDETERQAMVAAIRAEAEAQQTQQRLRRWDTDGDGKLSETETAAMEAALGEARRHAEEWRHRQELERWDKNSDGELSEEETAAMEAAHEQSRRRGEEWRRQWEREQYDLDGDGQLNEEERMLAEAARARREAYARGEAGSPDGADRRAQFQETIARWRLQNFDVDNNGELDEAENAAVKGFERRLRDVGQSFRKQMGDLNHDGDISQKEREIVRQEWRDARWKIFARSFRYMDGDGDGQISVTERQGFQHRIQTGMMKWVKGFSERFDANKDGRLGPRERETLIEGIHKNFGERIQRFDADKDGRLNPTETIEMIEDFAQKELGIHPSAPQEPQDKDEDTPPDDAKP